MSVGIRRPSRLGSMDGGDPEPVVLWYPAAERERQERLRMTTQSRLDADQGLHETYLPPETAGVTDAVEEDRRRRFLLSRGKDPLAAQKAA